MIPVIVGDTNVDAPSERNEAMSATPTFSAQVIGQTEKALNAILDRLLIGTGLTEPQWVTLTVTVSGDGTVGRAELVRRMAGFLKVSPEDAQARIAELAAAQLLEAPDEEGSPVKATEAGRALHARIRAATAATTERLWGDLAPADLATSGRVLGTVLERANAELA
jgi:DNA-binding MarR family transcriptional regulator